MTVTPIRPDNPPTARSSNTTLIRIQKGIAIGAGASLVALGLALAITAYGESHRTHALLTGLTFFVVGAICFQIAASRDTQLTVTAEQERLGHRMSSVLRAENAVLNILEGLQQRRRG